ncbi:hypothetical protein PDJAM_G00054040 [Pangasius djambal]|uniref:Uncharacterized protein n=1 Tax=Pangasius djambal TaxID=1691987 RepID=A0ACC5YXD8_9TELE|nr:hypothetical protein [Pangasius djambal]
MDFIMVVRQVHIRIRLLLACFLFLSVYGQTSGPYFMVTFPAVIESGSDAKFCVSLLKPNETLQMNIYLVHDNQSRTLLQETVEKEIHHCSHFEAPQVEGESVQEIKVEVKGESFTMTEKRKVMFKSYNTLAFIQTDKPIYNPGQTVNFRIVSMDSNFIPIEQKYSTVILEDNNHNRIGQWTNVSSTGLILQLSHELNAEAPQGHYSLSAKTENRLISHQFKVQKYVLPKFEITVKAPEEHSVGDEELKLEVCGKYTYGQPVPGAAVVQVCRKFKQNYFHREEAPMISPCLVETVEMSQTGCALLTLNVSTFINSEIEDHFENQLNATVTLTEEGTEFSMVNSVIIQLTFQIGKVEFVALPKTFERDSVIEGKIRVTSFSGTPIPNRKVYLLEGSWWPKKILFNLTTDSNGLADFSVTSPEHPTTEITLHASVYPEETYREYNTPFFTDAYARIELLQPATPYNPVFSELSIESSEEPFKCGAEIPITINYYIVGETTESYSIDIVYMVISKGVIVHHGHEKVEVEDSTDLRKGKISFKLSVVAELAPVVQVVVYSVLPSENIIAANKNFDVEKCFRNKVSLQFSPSKAVPGEKNTLELTAHPGSLCGLSVVDQSVFILESGDRLNTDKVKLRFTEYFAHTSGF